MKYELVIPGWIAVSDNRLTGCHWAVKHKLKQGDKDIVGFYFKLSGIPKAKEKRRVSVTLYKPRRAGDTQNVLKSCLDALKASKAIVDDSPRWLELGELKMERGERKTVIVLEDIAE